MTSPDDFLTRALPRSDRPGPWFPAAFAGECGTCFMEFEEGDTIRADGEGGWEAQDHGHDDDESQRAAAPRVQVLEPVPAGPETQNHPTDHRPGDETVNEDAQSELDQDEERTEIQEAEAGGKVQCSLCPRWFASIKSGRVRSHKAMDAETKRLLEDNCDGSGQFPREHLTPVQEMRTLLAAGPQPGPNPHRPPLPTVGPSRELTQAAVEALQRRTPEQKAATAARMDAVASAALGLPLDPGNPLAETVADLPVGAVVEVGGLVFTKTGESSFPAPSAGGTALAIDARPANQPVAPAVDDAFRWDPWDENVPANPEDPWLVWENRARAVRTRLEAAVLYREMITAGVAPDHRKRLTAVMRSAVEPGPAAVEAAADTPLTGLGTGNDPGDDDLVEQMGPWHAAREVKTRAQAAALYQEAKDSGATPAQMTALTAVMNEALKRTASAVPGATVVASPAVPKEKSPVTGTDSAAQNFITAAAEAQPEPARDRWGRYLLLHPHTGEPQAWTRATTFAKSCADTYALSQWGARMTVIGLTKRDDLLALAHGKDVSKDKKTLDKIVEDAKSAAGDKVAANKGTALHSFTETVDTGRGTVEDIPEGQRADVSAYRSAMEEAGLEVVLAERITVVTGFDVAGTFDRVLRLTRDLPGIGRAGDWVIGDLKTGRDLSYGWGEIAVQLAVYAHGVNESGVWDAVAGCWQNPFSGPGRVREDTGIVMHLPVGAAKCTLYRVNLTEGWRAAQLCAEVRQWRKAKDLAEPIRVATVAAAELVAAGLPSSLAVRPPSWEERFSAVQSKQQAAELYEAARKDLAGADGRAELNRLVGLARIQLERLNEQAA